MNSTLNISRSRSLIKSVSLDLSALLLIYFTPALAHLSALPVYFIEPIRLMLVLSIAHSTKSNTFFLALTLPVFSHIFSSHPVFLKTVLISSELALFTFLFFELSKRYKSLFTVMIVSIAFSKLFYYLLKYFLINQNLIQSELISTPIFIQIITTLIFSLYVSFIMNKNKPGSYKF